MGQGVQIKANRIDLRVLVNQFDSFRAQRMPSKLALAA
jgi:hypothetical protein